MSAQDPALEVPVIVVPEGITIREFLLDGKKAISNIAVKYRKSNGNPPMTKELEVNTTFLRTFLPWLGTEVQMTPTLRDRTQIHRALEILSDPAYHVPDEFSRLAQSIYSHFAADNWGATSTLDGDGDGDESSTTAPKPASTGGSKSIAAITNAVATMRLPPASHPIWGTQGIMHGVALQPGRRISYVLDHRYLSSKRDAKVFGHNGLTPGAWWPLQIVALFNGAHGARIRGISGDVELGTWSVVISGGAYDDLDSDFGDEVWYSGDGSHDNEDRERIVHVSNATRSLHTSLATGKPVRVLRSGKGKTAFAPSVGIRYDGLYRVVATRQQKNARGGLYEQFRLERVPGQPLLDDIRMSVPTARQRHDFNRIGEKY